MPTIIIKILEMRIIKTTPTHEIWEDEYEGNKVQFTKNLLTDEIHVNAKDFARVIGFNSLEDMMMDDKILDCINEVKEETGVFPITKQNF
jgi:hypothetical protein